MFVMSSNILPVSINGLYCNTCYFIEVGPRQNSYRTLSFVCFVSKFLIDNNRIGVPNLDAACQQFTIHYTVSLIKPVDDSVQINVFTLNS